MDCDTCTSSTPLVRFVNDFLSGMAIILGGSSILVWLSLFTSSSVLFSSSSDSLSSFQNTIVIFGLLTPLIRCGYAAAASRFFRFFKSGKILVAAVILSAVSLPAVSASSVIDFSFACIALRVVGIVFAAAFGAAYLMPRWIDLIARFDSIIVMMLSGASFFVFSLIYFALMVLPPDVLPIFSMVFPLVAGVCFLFADRRTKGDAAIVVGALKGRAVFYIALLACGTFFFGLIGQIIRALTWSQFSVADVFTSVFHEAGISLAALFVCMYVPFSYSRGMDKTSQMPGVFVLFIVALGVVVPGVVNRDAMPIADAALGIGLGCLQIQLFYYAAILTRRTNVSSFMAFGVLYSPLEIAGSIGLVAMNALSASSVEWSRIALIIVVALFMMMFIALLPFFRNQKTIITCEVPVVSNELDEEEWNCEGDTASAETSLHIVLHSFCLTSREEQVALLLLKGRSLPYVQQELNISEGTAKTHVSHIYRKCGVHTRQEFLDLIHKR